jgi:hypothetical protein
MLNDFVFLESQPPSPICRHMGHCSLSLYLNGCSSCEFFAGNDQNWEFTSLATTEQFSPVAFHTRHDRTLKSPDQNQ